MIDKYARTAVAIREVRKTFLTSSLNRQKNSEENPSMVIKMLVDGIKHNFKKAKVGTFINNVNEAEKEFEEVSGINERATYLQVQLLLDKIVDKISYAISMEEPDFDMEAFRRKSKSVDIDRVYRHSRLRSKNHESKKEGKR